MDVQLLISLVQQLSKVIKTFFQSLLNSSYRVTKYLTNGLATLYYVNISWYVNIFFFPIKLSNIGRSADPVCPFYIWRYGGRRKIAASKIVHRNSCAFRYVDDKTLRNIKGILPWSACVENMCRPRRKVVQSGTAFSLFHAPFLYNLISITLFKK